MTQAHVGRVIVRGGWQGLHTDPVKTFDQWLLCLRIGFHGQRRTGLRRGPLVVGGSRDRPGHSHLVVAGTVPALALRFALAEASIAGQLGRICASQLPSVTLRVPTIDEQHRDEAAERDELAVPWRSGEDKYDAENEAHGSDHEENAPNRRLVYSPGHARNFSDHDGRRTVDETGRSRRRFVRASGLEAFR